MKWLFLLLVLLPISSWAGMTSQLNGAAGSLAAATTNYLEFEDGVDANSWNATETRVEQVMPTAGTLDDLRIKCTTAPGAGNSRGFDIMQNNVPSVLASTITDTNTSAADTTDSFTVVAGDKISIKQVTSTAVTASTCRWVARFTSNNVQEYPVLWGSNTLPSVSSTHWVPVQGTVVPQTSEALAESVMPTGGTFKSLYVQTDGTNTTSTFTFVVNGASTSLSCNMASTSCNDTTHSVTVNAGDTVSSSITVSGTSNRTRIGYIFSPTTDGEAVAFLPATFGNASALTRFGVIGNAAAMNATETNREDILIGCTLKKMYVIETSTTALPNAETIAFTVRRNAGNSIITKTITGDGASLTLTGNDTADNVVASDDDLLSFQTVNSANSGVITPNIGLVMFISQGVATTTPQRTLTGVGL